MPNLEKPHDLLKSGKLVEALDALLETWGGHRAKAIATLVTQLGALINRSLPPIITEGVKRKVVEEIWLDIAARRRAADIPRLLAVLKWASAPLLKEWTHQLSGFKPDPRISAPLDKAANRFTSSGAGPTRTAAGRLIKTLEPPDSPPSLSPEDKKLAAKITSEIERRMKQRPATQEALFAEQPRKAEAEAKGESLLKMVLDAPSDMRARIVYGDWLSEANDPRGELIALQANAASLPKARQTRIAELVKTHGASWIRPLDSVVHGPRFELGFLSGCEEIKFRTKLQREELLQHPLWATVREIDSCHEDALLVSGALRSLEHLDTSSDVLAMLVSSKTPPTTLRSVALSYDVEEAEEKSGEWNTIATVGKLKNLTRLRVELARRKTKRSADDLFSWLFDSKLGEQLESLEIDSGFGPLHLDELVRRLGAMKNLNTLTLEATPPYARGGLSSRSGAGGRGIAGGPCPVRWRLTRSKKRGPSSFECVLEIGWPYYNDRLREIGPILTANLRGFPRADIPTTTIEYVGRPIKAAELDVLMRDVKRLIARSFKN